jgi:predicted Rossmann fold flavoprotein
MAVGQRVGIVGAGPAGIMAALHAAGRGAQVLLFDRNQVVGRKLLVTGNGRCNLTNANVAPGRYACADRAFLEQALGRFGRDELLATLAELGVLTYATEDGWYYPLSNSAATVADALASALERTSGIELYLQTKISDLRRLKKGFVLEAGGPSHTFTVDRVIVAAGGKAYPALGSKGELFPVLQRLGHTVVPIRPALVPIRAEVSRFHKLQGVRLDVGLALYQGQEKLGETVGNLMFTQFGFSGPAAMDLSHLVPPARRDDPAGQPQTLVINLVPHHLPELRHLIARKRADPVPLRVVLGAVLPAKIPPVLLGLAGLPADLPLNRASDRQLEELIGLLTGISVAVKGTRGFQFSQVSAGGVPVTEVEPHTMASRRVPGLYLAGEVLDMVGPCGGYNLQFAFSSGALAGMAAGGAG